jgi:hypothetical protein
VPGAGPGCLAHPPGARCSPSSKLATWRDGPRCSCWPTDGPAIGTVRLASGPLPWRRVQQHTQHTAPAVTSGDLGDLVGGPQVPLQLLRARAGHRAVHSLNSVARGRCDRARTCRQRSLRGVFGRARAPCAWRSRPRRGGGGGAGSRDGTSSLKRRRNARHTCAVSNCSPQHRSSRSTGQSAIGTAQHSSSDQLQRGARSAVEGVSAQHVNRCCGAQWLPVGSLGSWC